MVESLRGYSLITLDSVEHGEYFNIISDVIILAQNCCFGWLEALQAHFLNKFDPSAVICGSGLDLPTVDGQCT